MLCPYDPISVIVLEDRRGGGLGPQEAGGIVFFSLLPRELKLSALFIATAAEDRGG